MQTRIECDCCGSSMLEFNSNGFYVCAHCGTQYTGLFGGDICRKIQLTELEYTFYLKKIAVRLSEDENTPIDILDFEIVEAFKFFLNNTEEYHFKYAYLSCKYYKKY